MLPEKTGTHYPAGFVGLGAGLDGTKKFDPTGIRSADRLALSESLYRLGNSGRPWQS
jgi:hypothetical protein